MAFIPVPNTVGVRLVHQFLGQPITNTLYVRYPNPPDFTDLTSLAGVVANLWTQHIMNKLSNQAVLSLLSLRDLTTSAGVVYDYSGPPLPVSGAFGGPPCPSSVSAVFSLKTGLAGRSYRGRLYIGGFSEQQTDGNFLLSSVLNALRDGLLSVIDGINNADRQVVVVSRYNERQARQTAVTTPIQSVQIRTFRLASQRKRLP